MIKKLSILVRNHPFILFIPPVGFALFPLTDRGHAAKLMFLFSFITYLYTFISIFVFYYLFFLAPFWLETCISIVSQVNWVIIVLLNIYMAYMVYIYKFNYHQIPPLRYLASSRLVRLLD